MDSLDELAKKFRALAESVAVAAPQSGGRLRKEVQWVFEPHGNSAQFYQAESVRIDWPRVQIGEWIATFDGFKEIVTLLDESPHVHKWIATRVNGPDAVKVRAIGLQLFIEEFIVGVMDDAAWRVSEDRFLDALGKLRVFLTEGRVFYHSIMFLHGLEWA